MAIYVYWFLLAFVLIGLEMATGTFYLLMLGAAAAVGGLAAMAGSGISVQFLLSALAVMIGAILLRRWKGSKARNAVDVGLDVGQAVKVLSWRDDGTVRVFYRGTEWDAQPESASTPHDTTLYIKTMHGSTLVLSHQKPQQ